jgi:hypothetical protein
MGDKEQTGCAGPSALSLDDALEYADDFGDDWDGAALHVLAAAVRDLQAKLSAATLYQNAKVADDHAAEIELVRAVTEYARVVWPHVPMLSPLPLGDEVPARAKLLAAIREDNPQQAALAEIGRAYVLSRSPGVCTCHESGADCRACLALDAADSILQRALGSKIDV